MLYCLLVFVAVILVIKLCIRATNARCKSNVCLVGKTALITGGNSGLGLNLAKNLAARGCTVVIADKTDATSTVASLISETHNANIFYYHVDFSSFKSVRTFAQEFKNKFQTLHILVNNAGIACQLTGKTQDGLQTSIQINYFSHFLLTHLLLDMLLKSAPSRILFSSSLAAYSSSITSKNINGFEENTELLMGRLYCNSKAALALMSKTLSKKLANTGVTSNAHHPGIVKTNIFKTSVTLSFHNIFYYLLNLYTFLFGKNADEGVQTLFHMACANEVENTSGKFFMECRPVWQPKQVNDDSLREEVWSLSEKYTLLKQEEKADNIIKNSSKTK